jgi:hypothetical protein
MRQADSTSSARMKSVWSPRNRIQKQSFVSVGDGRAEIGGTKVQRHGANLHPHPDDFRFNPQDDAFVRLDAQRQQIGLQLPRRSGGNSKWRDGTKLDVHFGDAFGQPLARPQVKGHASQRQLCTNKRKATKVSVADCG